MENLIPFIFGADYYPEHWPEERWETDARMMREFGLDVVRIAEFAWAAMEPEDGTFTFEWLDRAIQVLSDAGLKIILGTPTAAPPAWMINKYPEILPVDSEGRVRGFGGRHHDCQSNPTYRAYAKRIVTKMAERYGENPAVVGWQVDNELGNSHGDLCHCASCRRRFQEWLKQKYGNIDELNRCWGTAFWSQGYRDFSEIYTPAITVTGHNPSQELDWKRFCSDLICEFHEAQAKIIREKSPGRFITHNMMGFSDKVSYYDLSEQLDFAAHDQYPGGHFLPEEKQSELRYEEISSELAVIRGVKDRPFMIMEQQSSITGWEVLGRAPKPGQLALWSMQSIAHGADAVVYFRWRSCLMGTEQYWHGILSHSGIPGRNYRELNEFVTAVKPLMSEISGSRAPREAAILYSYDESYAMSIQPHHPKMRYVEHLRTFYNALHRANIPTDFMSYEGAFEEYKAIIAPLYFLTDESINRKMREYVEGGGTLVLDLRAGIKDMNNLCVPDVPLPAGLSDLAGIVVEEYDCLRGTENTAVWDGEIYSVDKWCDIIRAEDAEVLAVYGGEFYAGTPVITRNRVGKGLVYYIGTEMPDALADRFVREIRETTGLMSLGDTVRGVEIVCRDKEKKRYIFVLNHTGEEQSYPAQAGWKALTGGEDGKIGPNEYRIFETEK